jgi:hypothetical protein
MTEEQEEPTEPRIRKSQLFAILREVTLRTAAYIKKGFIPTSTYEAYGIVRCRLAKAMELLELDPKVADKRNSIEEMIEELLQAASVLIVHVADMTEPSPPIPGDDEAEYDPKQAADDEDEPDDTMIEARCQVEGCTFLGRSWDEVEIHFKETGHNNFKRENGSTVCFDKALASRATDTNQTNPTG